MPVSTKESEANINTLLGLGLTNDQITGYGNKLNPNEMQTIAARYGKTIPDLTASINGNQVADQASVSATSGVPTRATPTDLLSQYGGSGDISNLVAPSFSAEQAYKDLLSSNGVSDLETQLNALKTDEQTAYDQFMVNKRAETSRGGLTPINVVEGRISEQGKNTQNLLDTITRNKSSIADELTSKYNSINQLMNLKNMDFQTATSMYNEAKATHDQLVNLQLQYPGAKISVTDSTETIASKIQKSNEKDAIKQLYLTTFGSTGKGMSTGAMEKKLKGNYKSEKSYNDEVRSISMQTSKAQLQNLLHPKAAKAKEPTQKDAYADMGSQLNSVVGTDGYIDPVDWNTAKKSWRAAGYTAAAFDKEYADLQNPNRNNEYK